VIYCQIKSEKEIKDAKYSLQESNVI